MHDTKQCLIKLLNSNAVASVYHFKRICKLEKAISRKKSKKLLISHCDVASSCSFCLEGQKLLFYIFVTTGSVQFSDINCREIFFEKIPTEETTSYSKRLLKLRA